MDWGGGLHVDLVGAPPTVGSRPPPLLPAPHPLCKHSLVSLASPHLSDGRRVAARPPRGRDNWARRRWGRRAATAGWQPWARAGPGRRHAGAWSGQRGHGERRGGGGGEVGGRSSSKETLFSGCEAVSRFPFSIIMTPPPANGGGGGGGDVVDLYGFPLPSLDAASLAARAACDVAAARRAPRWEGVAAGGELPPADELKAMARKVCVCVCRGRRAGGGGGGPRNPIPHSFCQPTPLPPLPPSFRASRPPCAPASGPPPPARPPAPRSTAPTTSARCARWGRPSASARARSTW